MSGAHGFYGCSDGYARARLVRNNGGIIEGEAQLINKTTWLGQPACVPVESVETDGVRFHFDHITDNGKAVYLEEIR